MSGDTWAMVANYDGDSAIAPGSKCWVGWRYGSVNRIECVVRSRGGHLIRKHLPIHMMHNVRAKWMHAKIDGVETFDTRQAAEDAARRIDTLAQDERARRNMRQIERMAGLMDERGRRNHGTKEST